MLAACGTDPKPNFGDEIDKALKNLTTDELITLFFGSKEDIRVVREKHKLPMGAIDMMCCMIDGEPLSTMLVKLQADAPPVIMMVPPKNKQH